MPQGAGGANHHAARTANMLSLRLCSLRIAHSAAHITQCTTRSAHNTTHSEQQAAPSAQHEAHKIQHRKQLKQHSISTWGCSPAPSISSCCGASAADHIRTARNRNGWSSSGAEGPSKVLTSSERTPAARPNVMACRLLLTCNIHVR
jgi:hypothetical protein